jgi:hypothetical protein
MSITAAVFQSAMLPYVVSAAVGLVSHAVAAFLMFEFVIAHTEESELHVGYAVRSVDPQLSYTPRLMQSARPTPSNAEVKVVTRSTFHAPMFTLNADAYLNACKPSHTLTASAPSPNGSVHCTVHAASSGPSACGAMCWRSTVETRGNGGGWAGPTGGETLCGQVVHIVILEMSEARKHA